MSLFLSLEVDSNILGSGKVKTLIPVSDIEKMEGTKDGGTAIFVRSSSTPNGVTMINTSFAIMDIVNSCVVDLSRSTK